MAKPGEQIGKPMECFCGARIVRIRLPEELAALWGRRTWWRADDGSATCYGDRPEAMSARDRQARHEPYEPWVEDAVI